MGYAALLTWLEGVPLTSEIALKVQQVRLGESPREAMRVSLRLCHRNDCKVFLKPMAATVMKAFVLDDQIQGSDYDYHLT